MLHRVSRLVDRGSKMSKARKGPGWPVPSRSIYGRTALHYKSIAGEHRLS
jgi:hypothetical protein